VKWLLKNGVSGRQPAVRGYWRLSFPENEGAVKGNFPAGASMPVQGVVRTSWVWDSVIFFPIYDTNGRVGLKWRI
jgi:hypothetical protein